MRSLLALMLLASPALAQSGYYRFSVDQDRLAGAPDFGFLNRALGPADRIFVRGPHFYRAGPDGKPHTSDDSRVRFFGVNLCFGANFPEEQDALRIAKRLRKLGVNLVRLHHMDSSPDPEPSRSNSTLTTGPYPTFNPVALARLRRLLDALAAEGIYVNLNLHVGYRFRPAVDGVPAPVGGEFPNQSKPLQIFHPKLVELQAKYAAELIGALNLAADPVLAVVEVNNESSLVDAWMKGHVERFVTGEYRAELERQWRAWRKDPASELVANTDAANPLADEYLAFLVDIDRRYLDRIAAVVRDAAGPVPVAGTQVGFGGLLIFDSHANLDYHDNHFYIDHYNFPNQQWDARDWRIRDTSATGTGFAAYLNMALTREAGRPYTVSEYNQPWPNRQGAESNPTLAAFAAFQDWDGLIHFAYSHNRNWDNPAPSGFDLNSDQAKWPGFGQSAWLFRTGAVAPGRSAETVPLSHELRMRQGRGRAGQPAAFLKTAGLDLMLALTRRVAVERRDGGSMPDGPAGSPYRSDTGELVYDEAAKVFTVASPRAAGVFGFCAGRRVTAGAIDVELAPSSRGFASILVTPLDDRPLRQSRRMLLSNPGYAMASAPDTDPPRVQKLVPYQGAADWLTIEPDALGKPSGSRGGGVPPVWLERVEAVVTLQTGAGRIAVYPLDGAGARLAALPASAVERTPGGFRIHLQADGQAFAPWYEVVAGR